MPGAEFPSWVPGFGDPVGHPTGPAPAVLPFGISADPWSLADQSAIQAGGPVAWRCVDSLPEGIDDCAYVPSSLTSA